MVSFICSLRFQYLNKPTNQNLLSQRIRKRYYETLGTSVINIPMFLPPKYRDALHLKF